MNISVLGCGRWGSFLAWYHSAKNDVTLWGREGSRSLAALRETGGNRYLKLPERVCLTSDLGAALESAQLVVISISAQELRALARCIQAYPVAGKTFILCMKGLECGTGDRLTQVFRSEVTQPVSVAVWVGPGHVEDFTAGVPNCMVVDSDDRTVVDFIVKTMSTDLIRLYKGGDLVGTEVGAAAKNVIGIAAGMLDGMGLSSLKGALMSRGTREVSRLIAAMGGNGFSAYGLCHLGDYEATVFSQYSHNRRFGEMFVRGEPYTELAEGYDTVKALCALADRYHVDLPIGRAVYAVLYDGAQPKEQMNQLFTRSLKREFDI